MTDDYVALGEEAEIAVDPYLRDRPSFSAAVVTAVTRGTRVQVVETNADTRWCRVALVDDAREGWVPASVIAPPAAVEPITPDTTLLHRPRAQLAQLTRALLARPHGNYNQNDVRFIARLYTSLCPAIGLDHLLAVAQMRLETGNLSSPSAAPPHYNPAGIGVTGTGDGLSFPSWGYSVRAHLGRLLAYALPESGETRLQKRVIDEALLWRPLPGHLRGAAPTLRGLAGTWAADPEYAIKISSVANEILGLPAEPTPAEKPQIVTARSLGLVFKNLFGELGPEQHVTGHYSAGARAKTIGDGKKRVKAFHSDHMKKGWGGIGYHYVISDDGGLLCARPTILKGAHVEGWNSRNIGVNMPGTTGDRPTTSQAATFRWLLANAHTTALPAAHRTDRDLRRAKRWGHRLWPKQATGCPGLFLSMYLSGGAQLEGDEDDVPAPAPSESPAGEWQGQIFVDYEHISPEEAAAARDPDSVEAWLPPPDPRFDAEK